MNLANASPTQSFESTVLVADDAIPAVSAETSPSTTLEAGDSALQTPTTAETSATDFDKHSGDITLGTGAIDISRNVGGRGEQLVTGIDEHTEVPNSPAEETDVSDSLKLRRRNVRKASQEKLSAKNSRLPSDDKFLALKMKIRRLTLLVMVYVTRLASLVVYIVKRGLDPITKHSTLTVVKEQERRAPFTNALFSLGAEASSKHCPELWACSENVQLALLVMVGGASERYLWKELKEVVYTEDNWARALYHLRHTLWPGGEVMKPSDHVRSEEERQKMKREAAEAIKNFLPGELF